LRNISDSPAKLAGEIQVLFAMLTAPPDAVEQAAVVETDFWI
jgi:hypothetical protein